MLFYHYSKSRYDELKCKRLTQHLTKEQLQKDADSARSFNKPGGYYDHISLFVDPIPDKTIAGLFNHRHEFWKSGEKLYMHVVDSNSLDPEIGYELVETPEMDVWSDKFDWYNMTKEQRNVALIVYYKEMRRRHLMGNNLSEMLKVCNKFINKTEMYYQKARRRLDAEETIGKYAANVPHLMVYPPSGKIGIKSVSTVVLA